eukprot:350030-Amorphochlora_amoeboformis.AAC.1
MLFAAIAHAFSFSHKEYVVKVKAYLLSPVHNQRDEVVVVKASSMYYSRGVYINSHYVHISYVFPFMNTLLFVIEVERYIAQESGERWSVFVLINIDFHLQSQRRPLMQAFIESSIPG